MENVTYPRAAMLEVRVVHLVLTSTILAMLTFFIVCHVLSIKSLRSGELMKKQNRWRLHLFMSCVCGFLANSLVAVLVWFDWSLAAASCTLIPSFLTMFFVNMRQFAGLVLYSRATVVHDGLRLKNSNLLIFREFLWYSITLGVWIIFGWSFWVNYAGKVVPEGNCVLYSRFPAVILSFAVLDALMTIAMLMLFVVPLTAHTREMAGMMAERNNNVSDKLKRIIKYNFTVSMVLATLDTLGLVGMTILLMIVDGEVVDPALEHLQMWALVPPLIAATCSFLGLHSMTYSWVPGRVRLWFNRKEFSMNDDLNASSGSNNQQRAAPAEVLYLGNLHADGKTIETQILVRPYIVPFDTLCSKIFGPKIAKRIAGNYRAYAWSWRIFLFVAFAAMEVVGFLIMMGIVPAWVSWISFGGMTIFVLTDNNYSVSTLKLLLRQFGPVVRILLSFVLMFFLFDIVNWDQRCPGVVTIFLGMQYAYFTDALVKESRRYFLALAYLLSMPVAFWVLALLQGDLIADRRNTVFVFNTMQRYEYSVYLAARDLAFLLCLLTFKDILNVGRGKGRQWFLFLSGDVAVKVVGLGSRSSKTQKLDSNALVAKEGSTPPNTKETFRDTDLAIQPRSSARRVHDQVVPNGEDGSVRDNEPAVVSTESRPQEDSDVIMNIIELREQDSLVVRLFGIKAGSKLLQVYTEPWFRLLTEWLLGFPLAFYVCAVLPGFVDVRFSYLFILSMIPFLRNFGLKSAMLMKLLTFRFEFLMELTFVFTSIIICVMTFQEKEKSILGYYLALFWLDIRTNDARCVFFHTGTRRGRRLSPFERFLFRAASVQIAGGFLALPVMLFLGITLHTDFYRGFKFVNAGTTYPSKLDEVFFYEAGANAIWLVVWKLILDFYFDLYRRGKGIHLRYIRAPIAPRFAESTSAAAPGATLPEDTNVVAAATSEGTDVFAASYREAMPLPTALDGQLELAADNPMMVELALGSNST